MSIMNKKAQFFPIRDDNPTKKFSFINWLLIVLNIVIFLISLVSLEGIIKAYGFTPAYFSILTIFTSMFLHGSLIHIFGNMWFLYIFGDNIEDAFGHFFYLLFYLMAGVVATMAHYFLNLGSIIPAVGASGAISGVLGAYIVLYPKTGVYVSGNFGVGKVSALLMIGLWFIFQIVSAFIGNESGIAFFAHIGGFVFGVFCGFIYKIVKR